MHSLALGLHISYTRKYRKKNICYCYFYLTDAQRKSITRMFRGMYETLRPAIGNEFDYILKLLLHSAMMYQMLPQNKDAAPGEIGQSLIQKQFFQMLPTDFTKQDAIKTAEVLGVAEATMKRWLTKYTQSNDIQRVEQGLYRKVIA